MLLGGHSDFRDRAVVGRILVDPEARLAGRTYHLVLTMEVEAPRHFLAAVVHPCTLRVVASWVLGLRHWLADKKRADSYQGVRPGDSHRPKTEDILILKERKK